jgi:hypothetical protein
MTEDQHSLKLAENRAAGRALSLHLLELARI